MSVVRRDEVLALGAYEEIRDRFRSRIVAEKKIRRLALGENMTAVFENHDTALYQIQEMLRTERISAEAAVLHEIETYNELVPGPNEVSITLMLEYPERVERENMLRELAGLESRVFFEVEGARVGAVSSERSDDKTRTTAVHYLKFPLSEAQTQALRAGGDAALVVDHPSYQARAVVTPALRESLARD